MDMRSTRQVQTGLDSADRAAAGGTDGSKVRIENFGCQQGEFILVSKWFALPDQPPDAPAGRSRDEDRRPGWLARWMAHLSLHDMPVLSLRRHGRVGS